MINTNNKSGNFQLKKREGQQRVKYHEYCEAYFHWFERPLCEKNGGCAAAAAATPTKFDKWLTINI